MEANLTTTTLGHSRGLALSAALWLGACGSPDEASDTSSPPGADETTDAAQPPDRALTNRAYVVSLHSDELTAIDLDALEIVGQVPTGGVENHMVAANETFRELYVTSTHSDELIVVDAATLEVIDRVPVQGYPTHMGLSPALSAFGGPLLAIIEEQGGATQQGAVSFLDTRKRELVGRVQGLFTPHFMRFATGEDGKVDGYVANFAANHLTRVDMETLTVADQIALDGLGPSQAPLDWEGGFADAQIASDGTLYAAHAQSGRVLTYDTRARRKVAEEMRLGGDALPWVVFAQHPFEAVMPVHVVNAAGTRQLHLIDGAAGALLPETLAGDDESYGVNFSPLTPSTAFVMKRIGQRVDVVDLARREIVEQIDVGGNTETAATSADGRYIVATVSDANRVVVIDAQTRTIRKVFEDVGVYPWAVFIPGGQNYCH